MFVIEAGIDFGFVGARQVGFGQSARAAGAFGDILAGQLEMHAAQTAATRFVYVESLLQFGQNLGERPRLHAVAGHVRVAVHGVAGPEQTVPGCTRRLYERRQARRDAVGAEAVYERQTSGFARGVERFNERAQGLRRGRRADLHSDGIGNAAEILHMRILHARSAHADPRKVRREVVILLWRGRLGLSFLVTQVQSFVAGEEVHTLNFFGVYAEHVFKEA